MHLSPDILKVYLRRLTNLSTRNRSLLLASLPAEQFLDWQTLDFVGNQSAFDLLKEVLSQKKTLKICQRLDARSEKVNEISKRLAKIARTERFIEEERGSEDLYVAYPFVRGKLMDGTPIHAPLAFFPVTLNPHPSEGTYWQLHRREESATLNRSFLLAYSHFNQVKITDELLETNLDELSRDPLVFRTELYALLKDSPLDINFNQELFQDHLQYFEVTNKADLDLLERNGELKLYPEAVLGIFPQAGSYLGPDYEVLIERRGNEATGQRGNEAEGQRGNEATGQRGNEATRQQGSEATGQRGSEAGGQRGNEAEGQRGSEATGQRGNEATGQRGNEATGQIRHTSLRESQTFTAFEQDASQEQALMRVKQGESLVVQGPPGTGKSQLIANLMTDFAARGKRVLLVCQKRVALDVVYERLMAAGMRPFMALVHDFKNDRAALYRQLDEQIENVSAFQKQNYSLDAIVLERKFLQVSRTIEQIIKELEGFREALYDDRACGLSPKELYLTSRLDEPHFAVEHFKSFRFDENLDTFLQKLRRYEQYTALLTPAHPWYERVSFATIGFREIASIKTAINEIVTWQETLPTHTQGLLDAGNGLAFFLNIAHQQQTIQQWIQQIDNEGVWGFLKMRMNGFFDKKTTQWYREWSAVISRLQLSGMLGDEIRSSELATLEQRLGVLIEARKSAFKWLFYGDKEYFKNLAQAYGLSLEIGDLYRLQQLLQNRQAWEQALRELEKRLEVSLLSDVQSDTDKRLRDFWEAMTTAHQAQRSLESDLAWLKPLIFSENERVRFLETVQQWLLIAQQTAEKHQSWRRYLTENQIIQLTHTEAYVPLVAALERDFELFVAADQLTESLTHTEQKMLQMARWRGEALGENVNLTQYFLNSLRLAWLGYLEEQHPILRAVSSLKISQLEEELQAAIQQKQALSREILGMQLREQTYKDVEFNRLQNRVTYREIQHQVTKKRKIWPVRKLMEQQAEEVFRLVPCWLASPETVSAVFPLTQALFDLVIFDEASQCYAEYGIPAIERARQVVVVGDSKQLTPYDLYRVRYEADNDDEKPELEVESLLDLAKRHWSETSLQGHYRSRSLDLIDFSNRYFYRNKLQLLPDFEQINRQIPAIQYLHVEGVWEYNRNEIEAQKVLELMQRLQVTEPHKSVGVVTFNHPQQQLIEGLRLESSARVFVKNIENIQGDECDILIFSVGYAPDIRGRLRAQFGSLNTQGGENRLNVAVTRARERVYVVTSIWPHQLHVEEATHDGPKLLKAYLEYALEVSDGRYRPHPTVIEKTIQQASLKKAIVQHQMSNLKYEASSAELSPPQLNILEELPFADLTVKQGEMYEHLILTDDDLYQQALSVKAAHAYLPLQLRVKGWRFGREWSREWWRKRAIKIET